MSKHGSLLILDIKFFGPELDEFIDLVYSLTTLLFLHPPKDEWMSPNSVKYVSEQVYGVDMKNVLRRIKIQYL